MPVRRNESAVDTLIAFLSILLGLFSVATLATVAYRNHTSLPWFDGWTHWSAYVQSGFSWTFLFSQHNEHRIPVSRLLYLVDERWFEGRTWFLVCVTLLAQAGSAILLYRLSTASSNLSTARRTGLLGVILAFAFSASQFINYTWTFQVCFVVVFFAAIGAFAALAKAGRSGGWRWIALSIAMALISSGSMANGLIVWPLLVTMAIWIGLRGTWVAALTVVGLAAIAGYVHGYEVRAPGALSAALAHGMELPAFAFAYLGSLADEPLVTVGRAFGATWDSYRVPVCIAIGAVGAVWFAVMVVRLILRPSIAPPSRVALLHVLAFLAASSALTALGRVQYPLTDALTSRYVTPSLLFWSGLIGLGLSGRRSDESSGAWWPRAAALLAAVLVGGIVQLPKVTYAAESERYLAEGEQAVINNVFSNEGWERFSGRRAGAMLPVIRYFRENHLASFADDWTHWIGDPVDAHFTEGDGADCSGAWESAQLVAGTFNPSLVADGWAYDRRRGRPPDRLVIVGGDRRIAGFGTSTRYRPDLAANHPETAGTRIGWRTYLPANFADDMTAYAISGDGAGICRVAATRVPGAYWTAPASKAGPPIAGVTVSHNDGWLSGLPPSLGVPPFGGETLTSGSGAGVLRFGPVTVGDASGIGLPVATGPRGEQAILSVVDRATGVVIAAAHPPPASADWSLWRFDVPAGAPPMVVDFVVELPGAAVDEWITVGVPRVVRP